MKRRRAPDSTPEYPLPAGVTTEHLKAAIGEAVDPLKTELRWQRYVVGALATAAFGPKIASIPALGVLLEPNFAAHLATIARARFGL